VATAVGIDLGTTNSVIAATEAGQPAVIPNAEGQRAGSRRTAASALTTPPARPAPATTT
jgi:molecular chaperone DnaK (HSP70)